MCTQCGRFALTLCNSVLYALTLIVFGASLHHERVRPTIEETVIAPDAIPASKAETVGADESPEAKTAGEVMEVQREA